MPRRKLADRKPGAPLSNPKYEKFSQLCASGVSPTDAYISLGYSKNGAATSALALRKTSQVSSRITELSSLISQSVMQQVTFDRVRVLRRMDKLSSSAEEAGQFGAAIRAEELIGKELGMFKDTVDHRVFQEPGKMTEAELDLWITFWEQRQLAQQDQVNQPALPAPVTIETTAVDDGEVVK